MEIVQKCTVCNFIFIGQQAPDKCPKCGSPGEKYEELTAEQISVIERSRATNALHVELLEILPRLVEIAAEGIEDELDPRCVSMFERLQGDATFLIASVKAELEGHVKKGKWG